MGNSFKLDDLLRDDSTETKPPTQKGAKKTDGFALTDLLGPDSTATAPAPAGAPPANYPGAPASTTQGDVSLATMPAPAPRRGIVARIGDALAGLTAVDPSKPIPAFDDLGGRSLAPNLDPAHVRQDETRTPAQITDYRSTQDQRADAADYERAHIAPVRPDATQYMDRAGPQAPAARAADKKLAEAQHFTPEGWRDVAKRGMQYTNELAAQAEAIKATQGADSRAYVLAMRAVDKAGRQSYNAQLKADGAADADTPGAIAFAAALGVIHDPYVQSRKNMATTDTFTPGEQTAKLAVAQPQAMQRPEDTAKDLTIPMAAGLIPFAGLDAVVAKGAGLAARGIEGAVEAGTASRGRSLLVRGLDALTMAEPKANPVVDQLPGIEGVARGPGLDRALDPAHVVDRLPGIEGVQQDLAAMRARVVEGAQHGMTQGQVSGAIITGREAAQRDEPVAESVAASIVANAVMGGGLGAVAPVLGAATRIPRTLLTEGLHNMAIEAAQEGRQTIASTAYRLGQEAFERPAPLPEDWAASRVAADNPILKGAAERMATDPGAHGAMNTARDMSGQTSLDDMTPEGQHAAIAKALAAVLDQKRASEPVGPDLGPAMPPAAGADWWNRHGPAEEPIVEPGTAFTPREGDNTALPNAADVAAGRVPATASDEANAVVQMQRARMEQEQLQAHVTAEQESLRIEQAATQRAAERHGPLTLGQTLARAGREADGETPAPLAVEYKEAIHKYADALATVQDAGENVGERAKLTLARTKTALDAARQKYGVAAGAAAVVALADANSDLTDDEKRMVGVAALPVLGLSHAARHVLPEALARAGRSALERIATAGEGVKTVTGWTDFLREQGVPLGEHFSATVDRMRDVARTQPGGMLDVSDVYDILRPDAPLHPAGDAGLAALNKARLQNPDDLADSQMRGAWVQRLENYGMPQQHVAAVSRMMEDQFGDGYITAPELARALDDPDTAYPEPPVEPLSRGFASRLQNVVTQASGDKVAFPKKWDTAQPAGDWIGKLKGMPEKVSPKELALIMPELERARAEKAKLTRDDVLRLIDDRLPRIERVTLAPSSMEERARGRDAAEPIVALDEIDANDRAQVATQIDARRSEIERLEAYVEEQQAEYAQEYEYAQTETHDKRREVLRTFERGFPNADLGAIEDVLEFVQEQVSSYDAMRWQDLDTAMNRLHETGEVEFLDAPRDPVESNIDFEEHEQDDGTTRWTATAQDGTSVEAPTQWQAAALLEDEGLYDSGSTSRVVPEGATVTHEPAEPRWRITHPSQPHWSEILDGERFRGKGDEHALKILHQSWGESYQFEKLPAAHEQTWVVRDENGKVRATSTHSADDAMNEAVEFWFDPRAGSGLQDELRSDIENYGHALADEREKESQHYYATEGEQFEDEAVRVQDYNDEIARLQEWHANATDPTPGAAERAPGDNPYLMPIAPPVKGGVHYGTYQRLPGGTEYAEMVNNWTNPPGGITELPEAAYGGHDYWTRADVPNAVGHIRAETHAVYDTPGLDGPRVEHFAEDAPGVKQTKDMIAENRKKRDKLLARLAEIGVEFDGLPPAEQQGTTANALAHEFRMVNQSVIDLGQRDEQLATDLRRALGLTEPPQRVRVMLESQASLAQYQINSPFTGPPDIPALEAAATRAYEAHIAAKDAFNATRLKYDEAADDATSWFDDYMHDNHGAQRDAMAAWLTQRDATRWDGASLHTLRVREAANPVWADYFEFLRDHTDARGKQVIARLGELTDKYDTLDEAQRAPRDAWNAAQAAITMARDWVDVSPFGDTTVAQQLNAARYLIDAAERGFTHVAWSDANNRIALAMASKPKAARLWYDQMIPAAMKRVMKFAGLPEPEVKKLWIKGYGHWAVELSPEARAHIRKFGVPFLSVAAMLAAPDDAEAQDGQLHEGANLYGTFAGGVAAGALVMAMAKNKKLRALVKENRAMNRALMLDDLSGLANKAAHRLAIETVDREPGTAWLAFDGDRFKQLNDAHGHPEGDKAIQHFGATLRAATQVLGVPMRVFRAGGDEFAMAVPQARAADVLRYVEEHSTYTQGDITTKLTGAIGDHWGEADALLRQAKDAARAADPTLAREWRGAPDGGMLQDAASLDTPARTADDARSRVGEGDRGPDAGPRVYTRQGAGDAGSRRVLGRDVRALATHEPDPALVARLATSGHLAPVVHELDASDPEAVAAFVEAMGHATATSTHGAAVYQYTPEEYAAMRLFLSASGKTGGALKGQDMVSLFSTEKGGRALQALRIQEGGRTLDAFDTVLPRIYAQNGMRVVSRLKWDDAQAPAGWNKATFADFNGGEPDVVFMVHDPHFTGDRLAGTHAASYDEAVAMQQAALASPAAAPRTPLGREGLRLYSNPVGPALAELRKYPSAAGLALVGYAMTDSDNENVKRAGAPVMALAALSAIGSDRLLAGKDYLASKLVEQLRKSPEGTGLVRAFNPDALLSPEVRAAVIQFERDTGKGKARAVEMSGMAKKLGGAGDRAVSDVLENEAWEDTTHLDAKQLTDVLTVAAAMEREYSDLTKQQVSAGTLPQSSVLPNYGGPRRYAYFEALDALADSPSSFGKPGRRPKIAPVKQRTLDVPLREAEDALRAAHVSGEQAAIQAAEATLDEARVVQLSRRVELGEIREASYRAAQGIERAHNNVASAKLFDTIRNVPGAAHPEWVQAVDDLLAAKQMKQSAVSAGDRAAAEGMFNEATVALDEVTKKYRARGGEYVSLPDVASLGVLRGAVVKRDIAHSLEGFGAPGLYGKTIRAWKEIKTVFNPGTSIGNILSNVTALHMGDVPVWLQPYYLTQAVRDLRSYGEGTRALAEAGVLNVNSVNALGTGELGAGMRKEAGLEDLLLTTRPETQQVLRKQGITETRLFDKRRRALRNRMLVGAGVGAAKGYDPDHPENALIGAGLGAAGGALFGADAVRKIYDNEDNVARLAVFLRRRALGDTPEQATEQAIASLGNFRSRSPALKLLSSTISPFVMYQAKAIPAFAKNVVDHPWKYMTLVAAWGAMNELGKQEMGEVPESDIPVPDRKTYGYFFPGFTQLPFGDERGNKAAVDVSRWTPMSGLTTGAPPGSVPEAFGDNGMALTTPGGPVIDAVLRGSNVDPYKKEPRLKRDRPMSENVGKVLNDAADFVLPSALGFHASRLKADIDNADWTKFQNDLLGPTGIKPKYVRPGAVATDAAFTLERSLRDMKQELKVALRANKDPDRAAELVRHYQTDVATALANFKDRLGTPPDAALVDEYLHP